MEMTDPLKCPTEIIIKFQYSFDEYIDAYRLHYSQLMRLRHAIFVAVGLLFLGVALCLFLGYSFVNSLPIYLSVVFVVKLLSEYFMTPNQNYFRDPRLQEEHVVNFYDDKIIFNIKKTTASVQWKQYSQYLENEEFYLLYYADETFLIIPKRAFKDDQQGKFKKLINTKLTPMISIN